MNNSPLLQCTQLNKRYPDGKRFNEVLHSINLSIQYREMIAIVGSSGSGKSTLLHLLGGLDSPSSGEIFFEGYDINALSPADLAEIRNRKLGFIYQFHHLLQDFTALENTSMPLLIGGIKPREAYAKAREMLTAVGLNNRGHHLPSELSGGERQRVAIARALINSPKLVLADEPTGNLDQYSANSTFELLSQFNIYQGTAFLVVTHDLQLAKKMHTQIEICNGILQPAGYIT